MLKFKKLISKYSFYSVNSCRSVLLGKRFIFSKTGIWPRESSREYKKELEEYWKDKLNSKSKNNDQKEKFYVVPMFPYPSGKLHLGHVRVYVLSDVVARLQRFQGKNVIQPLGWDSFGLPAENAAIENNKDPEEWTKSNIAVMKEQLLNLGLSTDWEREISTSDPQYYKWTQFLFLKLLENGLAYKKEALVNWDPVDKTVLANEQVNENGKAWRSNATVEKKKLNQWYFKSNKYNKQLYESLMKLSSEDILRWDRETLMYQTKWIGKCNGYTMDFKLEMNDQLLNDKIQVWTDQPELLYGASFLAISVNHMLNQESYRIGPNETRLQCYAIHPLTDQPIPVFVSSDFSYPESTNLKLGIPCANIEDKDFADKNNLAVLDVINSDGDSRVLINSGKFSGLSASEARTQILEYLNKKGYDVYETCDKLRDWLISRQRHWGTPIPIIHCPSCGIVPVPYENLPVILPKRSELTGPKGFSPLESAENWVNTSCPKCGQNAKRETDTMDTFVDSSWYYLRYLDPQNNKEIMASDKKSLMPVDLYIGGIEHAYVHLYYARFMAHFCHSIGLIEQQEPFSELLVQGMILGESYQSIVSKKYLKSEEIDFSDGTPIENSTGKPVIQQWEKMSKSKYNGKDPQELLDEYGIDTLRLFMVGPISPETPRKWTNNHFDRLLKWQHNLWFTVTEFRYLKEGFFKSKPVSPEVAKQEEANLAEKRNLYLSEINNGFLRQYNPNIAVQFLQPWSSATRNMPKCLWNTSEEFQRSLAGIIIVLAPIMPHFMSELWEGFRTVAENRIEHYDISKPLLEQKWPTVDQHYNLTLKIFIDKKCVYTVSMPKIELDALPKSKALEIALQSKRVKRFVQNGNYWTSYITAPGANVYLFFYPQLGM